MRLIDHPMLLAMLLASACKSDSSIPSSDQAPPTLVAATFSDASTIRLTFSEPVADPSAVKTDAFRLSIGVKDVESTIYYALDYEGLYDDSATTGGDGGPITDGDPTADPTIVDPTDPTTGDPTDATTDPTADPSETYDPSDSYDPTGGYEAGEGGYDDGYVEPGSDRPGGFTQPIPPLAIMDLDIASIAAVSADDKQIDLKLALPVTDTYACDALADLAAEATKLGIFVHYKPGGTAITDTAGNPLAAIAPHWIDKRSSAYTELQGDFPHLDPYLPIPCP